MANLKEIKDRISSVKKTKQITSAMKLVAAAKLKRATDLAVAARPNREQHRWAPCSRAARRAPARRPPPRC